MIGEAESKYFVVVQRPDFALSLRITNQKSSSEGDSPQAADQSVPEAHHHHHAEPGYEAAPVAQPAYGGTLDGQ
ncbi:hypothetical protein QYM36_008395 [Artemia franciscana]|uniref:Uncharacterized protein n=1 Tax=Artemia franciscana TaxID=6661 RepID=A0AA88IBC6_ARTSF|nr:hypothetical protein QYM36_008395 [Artemia franciscana]